MRSGDGLLAHVRAHLDEHGGISWQTALGIADWVIYPALAIRLALGGGKECSVEKGRRRTTNNVIYKILKRSWAKEKGAISDGNGGIVYTNWQKPEGAGAAPELAKKNRGRPRGSLRIPPPNETPD